MPHASRTLRRFTLIMACVFAWTAQPIAQELAPNANRIRQATQVFPELVAEGYFSGIREVHVIRPDLVMLRLDWGAVGGWETDDPGMPQGPYAVADNPAFYTITSTTDADYSSGVSPLRIARASQQAFNYKGENWFKTINVQMMHDAHLTLPAPLKTGHRYTFTVHPAHPVEGLRYTFALDYDDTRSVAKSIKVNQVSYSAAASRRYAYLGWWQNTKQGAVAFDDFDGQPFIVADAESGTTALEGLITLRRKTDTLSGEDIYQMDLSPLSVGRYVLRVPGLGVSPPFRVGGAGTVELMYHTFRGFYHQRCSIELGPPFTWVRRPASFTHIAENGWTAEGNIRMDGRLKDDAPPVPDGMEVREFIGGYHDAADFDNFTAHLAANRRLMELYEMHPEAGRDDFDIPESGNGIPDLLDEAEWNLKLFLQLQQPDGGVPLGMINECDSLRQFFVAGRGDARKKGYTFPPFGIIPPVRSSSSRYAAAAAQFSMLIRPFDADKADRYLASAKRAFAYDTERLPTDIMKAWNADPANQPQMQSPRADKWDQDHPRKLATAAANLLRATGDRSYEKYITAAMPDYAQWAFRSDERVPPFLLADPKQTDPALHREAKQALIRHADAIVRRTEEAGYRMGNGQTTWVGWGAAQGVNHSGLLIAAHHHTGDPKYLDALSLNADFHLGCNPIGKVFLTGMGVNPPRRPEISGYLYETSVPDFRGGQVKGIGIYGFGPPLKDPERRDAEDAKWPLWRSWADIWGMGKEVYSEFTVTQTVGPAAQTYGYLYAIELDRGLIPPDAPNPDPLQVGTESWRPHPDPSD
ncbi:MAG: glycoside hydrolase family 9 protein [Planctomycetota bacterium]